MGNCVCEQCVALVTENPVYVEQINQGYLFAGFVLGFVACCLLIKFLVDFEN